MNAAACAVSSLGSQLVALICEAPRANLETSNEALEQTLFNLNNSVNEVCESNQAKLSALDLAEEVIHQIPIHVAIARLLCDGQTDCTAQSNIAVQINSLEKSVSQLAQV